MIGVKRKKFSRPLAQPCRTRWLDLPQRLLAAAQRQSQAVMMIVGQRNQAGMMHGKTFGVMEYWVLEYCPHHSITPSLQHSNLSRSRLALEGQKFFLRHTQGTPESLLCVPLAWGAADRCPEASGSCQRHY